MPPPLLLAAIPLGCAALTIHAVPGEEIPLAGNAPGSDVVYLFLTGPNLPPGGISLLDGTPVRTGDPESFTRVEVLADGTWSYRWIAGFPGRVLDPGAYAVYAVPEPVAYPDLGGADSAVQPVILGSPAARAAVAAGPVGGTLAVSSTPGQATVILDGGVTGRTPLTLGGGSAGSHTLALAREGYLEYRETFVLGTGEKRVISAVLEPVAASPPAPAAATTPAPVTTKSAPGLIVPLATVFLAFLALRRR